MKHVLILLLLLACPLSARSQTTLNVPADYPTIQAALNAAGDGDTILVQPGTYYENLIWPDVDGITLTSSGGPADTIIDGGGIGHVIYIAIQSVNITNNTTIYGFTIQGGGNVERGAGVRLHESDPTLTDLIITDNHNSDFGGGLYSYISDFLMSDTRIIGNSSERGGGLYIWGGSPAIDNVFVHGNSGRVYAGGIYFQPTNSTLTNVLITGNEGGQGGGIYATSNGQMNIQQSTIVGNQSTREGGGLYTRVIGGRITLSNVTIANNSAVQEGNGIYDLAGELTIEASNIANNLFGLYNNNRMGRTVPATDCWWGDTSGPYHPVLNPNGLGDSISDFVNAVPFLTAPNMDAPPVPVQELTIANIGNDLDVSWKESATGDLAGYRVYYDTQYTGYSYSNVVDVGNVTNHTLTGLPLGTSFHVAVTVYDTDGNESWFSEDVIGTTRVLETQNLDIGGEEDLQHLVSHQPDISFDVYDSMGGSITSFQVQVSSHDDFSVIDMWDIGELTSTPGKTLTTVRYDGADLLDGSMYYLRARIGDGAFYSEWASLLFRMNSTPSIPTATNPIGGVVVTDIPALSIQNSTDAESDILAYDFHLASDADFDNIIGTVSDIEEGVTNTEWTIGLNLPDNQQF